MKLRYKLLIAAILIFITFGLFVASSLYSVIAMHSQNDRKTDSEAETNPITNTNICIPIEVTGRKDGRKIYLTFSGAFSTSRLQGRIADDGTFSIEDSGDASAVKMSLPSSPARLDFFSYMPQMDQSLYEGIRLDHNSKQYIFNQSCSNDDKGFRRHGDDYLVALGSYYGKNVGTDRFRLKFRTEDGKSQVITAVLGDVKADSQTDPTHRYHAKNDNTVLEFIMADRNDENNRIINNKFGTLVGISKIGLTIKIEGKVKNGKIDITGKCNGIDLSLSGTVSEGEVTASGFYGNGSGTFLWPCDPSISISDHYGWRMHPIWHEMRLHEGTDFAVPSGSKIYASAGGEVTVAGWYGGFGKAVVITHGNGMSSLYAHNSEVLVSVGDKVAAGQLISYSGNSGDSTGPHLHFEIRKDGTPVNPMDYLTKRSN